MPPITVTFDTNVFNHIVRPDHCPDASLKKACLKIRDAIIEGAVLPQVSVTIFDLESINRSDRRPYFDGYQPATSSEIIPSGDPNRIHGRVSIGPNPEGRPENNPIWTEKLEEARQLGFRVLSIPRIALPRSPLIKDTDYGNRTSEEMGEQHERLSEAFSFISSLGAGIQVAIDIAQKYEPDKHPFYKSLEKASKNEVDLAFGEWSDGDSIAGHISYRLDYFCTRDEAKSAGAKSIFSVKNRAALTEQFGVKFVTPAELLALLAS